MRLPAVTLLVVLISPAAAFAAAPPAAPAVGPKSPPTTVSGLTVVPQTQPPKVTASFPAAGETIAPGVLILKLTFDQKMLATGFDFAPPAGGEMPSCLKTPRLLNDGKTFVLLCTTLPKTSYALTLNAKPKDGFQNAYETRAETTTLAFSTNSDTGPRNIDDALKVAKLTEIDGPIEDSEFPPPATGAGGGR